jgi:phage tail sheath gpL-like
MAEIVLQGVGPNAPPGVYGVVNFAQGSGSLGEGTYDVLLLGNFSASGNAVAGVLYGPDTAVTLQSAQDSVNLFGDGYQLNRMFTQFISTNTSNRVYAMPVASASGVNASLAITVSVGSPQTAGVINFTVCNTVVGVVFGSSDSATTIAANAAGAINGNTHLPVVASAASGVLSLVAKDPGARGNWIRVGAQVVSGSGVLVNVPAQSPTLYTGRQWLASGSGSDSSSYDTVVTNLIATGRRFYTIVCGAGGDSVDASIVEYVTENLVDFSAQANIGIRQRLYSGSVDTIAHTLAVTTSLNDARSNVVCLPNSDLPPWELASAWAAGKTIFEVPFLSNRGVNFDNFGSDSVTQPYWPVAAPLDGSAPSKSDIQTAVVSGITLVKVTSGNRTAIVKDCTSHFWTGSSSQFDPRIVDGGKVTICDYFLDDAENLLATRSAGKLIGNDPTSGVPASGVFYPSTAKSTMLEVIDVYAASGLIDGAATTNGLVVQRGQVPTSRMEIQVPLFTADPLHTVVVQVNQTS